MNINELFGDEKNPKKELGFDLKDDLIFYMNNDPEFYRKKYFPTMLKFDKYCKEGKEVGPKGFGPLVKHAYECYKNRFPVEGLDRSLEEEMCESICKAIHEQELKNVKDKFYDLED